MVVLSHNRLDCLPRLFDELLLPATQLGVQVTFVDNASGPEIQQFLSRYSYTPGLELILSQKNLGVAGGRNLAFKRCRREFSVYLDDDALVDLDTLKRVPTVFDELPNAAILAFCVIDGTTGTNQNEHGMMRTPVGNFHGAGHAIRQSTFARIGYLDDFCFFGAEEIEYCMRARAAGLSTIYTPEIQATHFSINRSVEPSLRRRFLWARNYAMILFRYLPLLTASLFSLRLLTSYLFAAFKQIPLGWFILTWAMIQGAVKGLFSRNPLDAESVAFYSNPDTRPELGNVSILSKVRWYLRQKGCPETGSLSQMATRDPGQRQKGITRDMRSFHQDRS